MNTTLHFIYKQVTRRQICVWLLSIMMLSISSSIQAEEGALTLTDENPNTYLYAENGQWYYTFKTDDTEKQPFNGTITGTFTKSINLKSTIGTPSMLTIESLTITTDNWSPSLIISTGATATVNLAGTNEWSANDNKSRTISNEGNLTLNNTGIFHILNNLQNEISGTLVLKNKPNAELLFLLGTIDGPIKNKNQAEGSLTIPPMIEWMSNTFGGKKVKWVKQGLISESKECSIPEGKSGVMAVVESNENYTFFVENKQLIACIIDTDRYTALFSTSDNKCPRYGGSIYYEDDMFSSYYSINRWEIYGATAKVATTGTLDAATADVVIDNKELTVNSTRGLAWIANMTNSASMEIDGFKNCSITLNDDLNGQTDKNGKETSKFSSPWMPIGFYSTHPFKGTFEGNDKTIKSLRASLITNITEEAGNKHTYGLFGHINGATLQNLKIDGYNDFSTYSPEEGTSFIRIGQIAGYANNSMISNCHNLKYFAGPGNSNIPTENIWVGGIVGYLDGESSIINCSSIGAITCTNYRNTTNGGIAGEVSVGSSVTNCFATGGLTITHGLNTEKETYIGGIAGKNKGRITDCYSIDDLRSNTNPTTLQSDNLGGIAGINNGTIQRCYSLGGVYTLYTNKIANSSIAVGGIASANTGTISGCAYLHYNSYGSNFKIANGEGSIARISPLSTNGTLTNNYGNRHLSAKPDQVAADKTEGANAWSDINLPLILGDNGAWDYGDETMFPKLKKKGTTGSYTEWTASTQPDKTKKSYLKIKEVIMTSSGPYESMHEDCNVTIKSGTSSSSPNKFYIKSGTLNASVAKLTLEEFTLVENDEPLVITEAFQMSRTIGNKWSTFSAPMPITASVEEGKVLYVATGYNSAEAADQEWKNVTAPEGATSVTLNANQAYIIATGADKTVVTFKSGPVTFPAGKTNIELGNTKLEKNIYRFEANRSLRKKEISDQYPLNPDANKFYKQNWTLQPFEAFITTNAAISEVKSMPLPQKAGLRSSTENKLQPPYPGLPFSIDYATITDGGSFKLKDDNDSEIRNGDLIYSDKKVILNSETDKGYQAALGYPKIYKSADPDILIPTTEKYGIRSFLMPNYPITIEMAYEKAPEDDTRLKSIRYKVNNTGGYTSFPGFTSSKTEYDLVLPAGSTSVSFDPVAFNTSANKVYTSATIQDGKGTGTITVTSGSATTTYTFRFSIVPDQMQIVTITSSAGGNLSAYYLDGDNKVFIKSGDAVKESIQLHLIKTPLPGYEFTRYADDATGNIVTVGNSSLKLTAEFSPLPDEKPEEKGTPAIATDKLPDVEQDEPIVMIPDANALPLNTELFELRLVKDDNVPDIQKEEIQKQVEATGLGTIDNLNIIEITLVKITTTIDYATGNTTTSVVPVQPNDNVKVYIPYPEGTNKGTLFTVAHLKTDGTIEIYKSEPDKTKGELPLENSDNGLILEITSFSPFGIAWQTKSEPEPTPPPYIPNYYNVSLPATEGVTFDKKAQTYVIEEGYNFTFSFTLQEGYKLLSKPVVCTDRDEVILPRESDGRYIIRNVDRDITIRIEGILKDDGTPTGNIDATTSGIRAQVKGATLYIRTDRPEQVSLFTLTGKTLRRFTAPAGNSQYTLPSGIYLIRIGEQSLKVVVR